MDSTTYRSGDLVIQVKPGENHGWAHAAVMAHATNQVGAPRQVWDLIAKAAKEKKS